MVIMAGRRKRVQKVQIAKRLGETKTVKERAREFGLRTFLVKEEELKRKVEYLEKLAKEAVEKDLTFTKLKERLRKDGVVKPNKVLHLLMEQKWKRMKR